MDGKDPLGFEGGWNHYGYVGGDPVHMVDASGLAPWGSPWFFGGGTPPRPPGPIVGPSDYSQQWSDAEIYLYGGAAGLGIVGAGVLLVESPALVPAAQKVYRGAKYVCSNLYFDGPSSGVWHANGRIFGVRWKQSQWGFWLDLHPVRPGGGPVLHINPSLTEKAHIELFDPSKIERPWWSQ